MAYMTSAQKGFSLIEVLVTLLILAVGLLGLAGLQSRMLNAEFDAYQRTQALMLIEDMANRIRTNPAVARVDGGEYLDEYGTDSDIADDDCGTPVKADKCAWDAALKGASVTLDDGAGAQIGSMIGARGCVERLSGTATSQVVVRITVAWQGMSPTVVPDLACGQGEFGDDDSMRRAVSVLVTLAYLGV